MKNTDSNNRIKYLWQVGDSLQVAGKGSTRNTQYISKYPTHEFRFIFVKNLHETELSVCNTCERLIDVDNTILYITIKWRKFTLSIHIQ